MHYPFCIVKIPKLSSITQTTNTITTNTTTTNRHCIDLKSASEFERFHNIFIKS